MINNKVMLGKTYWLIWGTKTEQLHGKVQWNEPLFRWCGGSHLRGGDKGRLARVAQSKGQVKRHASTQVSDNHLPRQQGPPASDDHSDKPPDWQTKNSHSIPSIWGVWYKYFLVENNLKTHLSFRRPATCYMQTDNQRWEAYLPDVHGHEFRAVDWMQVIMARVKMPGKATLWTHNGKMKIF